MWQSVGLTLLVIVATLLCALLFMLFGWYVVWQLFLSKFKFLRELVGDAGTPQAGTPQAGTPQAGTPQAETQPSQHKAEPKAAAPARSRPKTGARQRLASPESS